MVNKRGEMKYNIIMSLILGLMILTIALFWIFGEFFGEGEIDWEVCRQSILVRAGLPEKDLVLLKTDTKGAFPLKCKTEVVSVDDLSSPNEVYEKISRAVAEGWYMFGEGELDFVHSTVWSSQTVCMAFARIHFDEEASRRFDAEIAPAWMEYFREEGYGIDPFRQGFQEYYRSAKVKNFMGTYQQYLPLHFTNEPSEGGSLVVNWERVSFNPGRDEDYLLVYMINKASGYKGDELFLSDGWEETKVIAIVSVDRLDSIECDKFLMIPA
jgi:hypothetical protein